MSWVIIVTVLVLLVLRRWKLKRLIELSNKVTCGIKSYTLIGHAYLFMGDGVKRMQTFQMFGRDAIRNGGMSGIWLGLKYYIVTVDAVDIEVILKTSLEKDNVMRFARNLIGNGSIFAPVAIWRRRRKALAPTLSLKTLNNFVPIFARQSNIMVEQLKAVIGQGVVSLWKYMATLTLDSSCETTMGLELGSQHNAEEPFLRSFEKCCKLIATRMVQPLLYPDSVYRLFSAHTEFVNNKHVVCDFVAQAIRSKRIELKENKNTTSEYKIFLELLMESCVDDRRLTELELNEEILVFVVASTDTSAAGIAYVVSMMANHQDVQEKVVEELYEVFGDSDRLVTAADLPRLKYLSAVVKETLRLYPPVPVIVRQIERDIQLPSGLTLVEGCSVLVNIWATHRNPVYWGNDAEQFRPERFLAPLKHPAAYLTFSTGPRNCLGYQYALMSMKTAVATLLRRYRVLSADDIRSDWKDSTTNRLVEDPFKLTFDVMMKDEDGFKVKLEKRSKLKHV